MRHQEVRYDITWAFTRLFRLYPPAYHWHARIEAAKYRLRRRLRGIPDDAAISPAVRDVDPAYLDAARELGRRGFDAVILGHTHRAGEVVMDASGARYINTGSWFDAPHYVTIVDGEIRLERWSD
jgi:UDP-2,3-diacylglucosamine pyrophosphatase LpxH